MILFLIMLNILLAIIIDEYEAIKVLYTVPILYSYCTHTVRILYPLYCTHYTVLALYSYCTHTVLVLYSSCTRCTHCTHYTVLD
jgi:hypothetical protein